MRRHPHPATPAARRPPPQAGEAKEERLLAETNFPSNFIAMLPVQSRRKKYSAFLVGQISGTIAAILSRRRGVGHRRKRGTGKRWTWMPRLTSAADAYGEIVRVRRPGAGVKLAEMKVEAGDGDKKADHQDEIV